MDDQQEQDIVKNFFNLSESSFDSIIHKIIEESIEIEVIQQRHYPYRKEVEVI